MDWLTDLRAALPEAVFREAAPRYLEEPRGRWQGRAAAVLAPGSTEEAARIVRACVATGTPIVPYGGGTGLVGGQVAQDGPAPVIVSMERMAAVREVDATGGTLTCEAGAILSDVHAAAAEVGRAFPLTLASQGSARIGGLLATNAGGVGVLRHGNARDLCLGIEAVLPSGTVFGGLTKLRKNNTGYDLRHLLIGAEGTLGLITAAVLRLVPQPPVTGAAMLVVADPAAALRLLRLAQDRLGPALQAFELIGKASFDFLAEVGPEVRMPFGTPPAWTCLIDIGLQDGAAEEALVGLVEAADNLVLDGVVAQSEAQRAEFWALREAIPEANRRIGSVSSHDISVPIDAVPEFVAAAPTRVAAIGTFRINAFGHLGDGNLHYNVFPMPGRSRADHAHQRAEIKRAVHDLVHEMGGSVSAEHGIGRLKVEDLERYGDPGKLEAMRAIKRALDPQNLFNPGAILRT